MRFVQAWALFFSLVVGGTVAAQVSPPTYDEIRQELFDETNAWRTENGASIMVRDQALDHIVQKHVEDKAGCGFAYAKGHSYDSRFPEVNGYISCDGGHLSDRISAAGSIRVPWGSIHRSAENMAYGAFTARDVVYTDLGLTSADLPSSIPLCSTGSVVAVNKPSNPAGPNRITLCRRDSDSMIITPGFIDTWGRSPDERTNMIGSFGFLGVGYAEGVFDTEGCTSTQRDGSNHLMSTAGCTSVGPIAGQMFGSMQMRSGMYSATGSSSMFYVTPPSTTPTVTTPPVAPPTVTTPPVAPPTVTTLPVATSAAAATTLLPVPAQGSSTYDEIRQELFDETNAWRTANGASILVRDQGLDQVMQKHVEDKAGCGFTYAGGSSHVPENGHLSCDGGQLGNRINAAALSFILPPGAVPTGAVTFAENMAWGPITARDTVYTDLGLTSADLPSSIPLCSTNEVIDVNKPSNPAGPDRIILCRRDSDSMVVSPGFIDGWDRSPGHRAAMIGSFGFLGVGYDEGIFDTEGCTSTQRDGSNHLVSTAGCNSIGPIAGQLFGSMQVRTGMYSATGSSSIFHVTPPSAPPPAVATGQQPVPAQGSSTYDEIRQELFDETNAWRTANSASVLVRDQALDQLIQQHVEDKAGCGYTYTGDAHASCDGSSLTDRINAASIRLPGGSRVAENMAYGSLTSRDVVYTDLGLTSADLPISPSSIPLCSTNSLVVVNKPSNPAGPDRIILCRRDSDSVIITPGFIDGWDRSPGHRTNMIGSFGFLGVGYDEGVFDAAGCTSTQRDGSNHLASTAGCTNVGSIAGQLFGSMQIRSGMYSATGSSTIFHVTDSTTPPTTIPPTTMPPTTTPGQQPVQAQGSSTYDEIRQELFDETNAWRTANSASVLVRDQALDQLIQQHVEDKAGCGYTYTGGAHASCDGSSLTDRINAASISLPGGSRVAENMAYGSLTSRDVAYTDLGLTSADLPSSIPLCSTNSLVVVNKPSNPAGPDRITLCRRDSDSMIITPGFIDGWDRSPGHRTNMIGSFGFLGVGYDEGVFDIAGCTSTQRDGSNHLTSTAGCTNVGPIAGQLFGSMQIRSGMYSATGSSTIFHVTDSTTPPTTIPPTTTPTTPPTTPPDVTQMGRTAVHSNMASIIEAVANLYELYGVYNTVQDEQTLSTQQTASLRAVLDGQSNGYGNLGLDVIMNEIRNNPTGHLGRTLQPYFQGLGNAMVAALINPLATPEQREAARQEFARIMRDFGSGQYDAAVSQGFLLNLSTIGIVTRHLSVKRSHSRHTSRSAPGDGPLVATTQPGGELVGALGLDMSHDNYRYREPSRHVWVRTYGRGGSEDRQNVLQEVDTTDHGFLIGMDLPISEAAQVGVYAGTGFGKLDFIGGGQDETKHYSMGAYGGMQSADGRLYGDVVVTATYTQHDHRRHLNVGNRTDTIAADYGSWVSSVQLGGGALLPVGELMVQPKVAIGYHYQFIEDFTESGSNPLRLEIEERKDDAWHAEAGFVLSRDILAFTKYRLTPRAGFSYLYQNSLDDQQLSARYAVAPGSGNVFVIQGRDEDHHYYKQNLGFELMQDGKNSPLRIIGDYQLLLDGKTEDHVFQMGLRYVF